MPRSIPALKMSGFLAQALVRRHRELAALLPPGPIEEKTAVAFVMILVEVLCNVRVALHHFGMSGQFDGLCDLARAKCDAEWPAIVAANTPKPKPS